MKSLHLLFFLAAILVIFTGCNLLNNHSSTDLDLLTQVPQSQNANLKMQIVLPDQNSTSIKPSIRSNKDNTATVKMCLINVYPGTEGDSQKSLIKKIVPVSEEGAAEFSFSGLPEAPVIAKITIDGGNLGGKTDFHGAIDLKAGNNTLEISPTGSGHPSDIAAGVMLEIIKNPEMIKAAPKNLVSTILNSAQNSINQNLSGSELYQDALNQFVTSSLNNLTTMTIVEITPTGGLKAKSGSWEKDPLDLWNNISGATNLKARSVIRHGISAEKLPVVTFSDDSKAKFALAVIASETGTIQKYFISDGTSLSHLSAVQILPEQNSIVFAAVANGLPVLIKWNMENSVVSGFPVTDTSIEWDATFLGITAHTQIPYPEVEQMSLEPSERTTLNCVVRDPKTMMLINYDVSLWGVVEARINIADISMHSLTAFPGDQEVTLNWDLIPTADYYTLYWSLDPEVPTTGDNVNSFSRVRRPFIHTGLTASTTYYYKLAWTINDSEGGVSSIAKATPWHFDVLESFHVVYYGNENTSGLVPYDINIYQIGSQATILNKPETLLKDGYTFNGWNTKKDGSGITYQASDTYTFVDAQLVLYALWSSETISITYDGNGNTSGEPPVDSNSYKANDTLTIRGNTGSLAKEHYNFMGWNTKSDYSGLVVAPGSSFQMDKTSITLYAIWEKSNPLIFYSSGHDSGTVPIDNNVYAVDDTVTVPGNTNNLTKEDYRFGGWKNQSNGNIYTTGQTFKMTSGGVTLEPIWYSNNKYQVIYNANNATSGTVPALVSYTNGDRVTIAGNSGNLAKDNKTFYGWNTSPSGNGIEYIQNSTFIMPEENLTLYAVWEAFAGGDGTVDNPYQVANANQLNRVRNHPTLNFIQTADIDLDIWPYNSGWEPIGSDSLNTNDDSMKFSGSYDGNSKKINNLYVNNQTQDSVGLFGYINGGTINNLSVLNADITGGDNVGILAGRVLNGSIDYCKVSGKIRAIGITTFSSCHSVSGGLSGYTSNTNVSYCNANVTVSGETYQGGLIGRFYANSTALSIIHSNSEGSVSSTGTFSGGTGGLIGSISGSSDATITIENCYSSATVNSWLTAGGLAGWCWDTIVNNCYATGNVTIEKDTPLSGYAGGLIGRNDGSINLCHAEGKVNTHEDNAGGLIGYNTGSISKSFAIGDVTSSKDYVGGFTGYNEGEISDSYSRGNVIGDKFPAGFCGGNKSSSKISRCYSSGSVTATFSVSFPKGFSYSASDSLANTIADCYWDTTTSDTTVTSGDATGLTTEEMQTQTSYNGWNFSSIWLFNSNAYPTLRNNP